MSDAPSAGTSLARIGGVCAVAGAAMLLVGTMLHPMNAPPSDTAAAFAEYARDRYWVATHLLQLAGVAAVGTALVALSWTLRAGRAGGWAVLAGAATIASVAVAGALQAVDGIALKFSVDRWAALPESARAAAFEAAYAVRQIEIGLASVLALFFGLAVLLHGLALALSATAPVWLGALGFASGAATLVAGVVQAHTGFTDTAMALTMPSSFAALVWVACIGVFLLRSDGSRGT